MNRLTNDMTRLRMEIGSMQAVRASLMKDVQNSAIRNRNDVNGMRKDFRAQHARTAKQAKSERLAFLSGVSRQVSAIRKDTARLRNAFRADIMGCHKAWLGAAAETADTPHREGRKKKAA